MQLKIKLVLGPIALSFAAGVAIAGTSAPKLAIAAMVESDRAGPAALTNDQVNYDEVGYASVSGDELRGAQTQSGEVFSPEAITAAHRSLPIGSFIEVTDLDSGRTILVRLIDRTVASSKQYVALSVGAARQLGVDGQSPIAVRVRRTNPPEFERRQLLAGGKATERLATPPALLAALRRNLSASGAAPTAGKAPDKPRPAVAAVKQSTTRATDEEVGADFDPPPAAPVKMVKPVKAMAKPAMIKPLPRELGPQSADPVTDNYYVQLGAFSSAANAAQFARKSGGSVVPGPPIWRVRSAAYADEKSARAALGGWRAKGYRDARITR